MYNQKIMNKSAVVIGIKGLNQSLDEKTASEKQPLV